MLQEDIAQILRRFRKISKVFWGTVNIGLSKNFRIVSSKNFKSLDKVYDFLELNLFIYLTKNLD